VKEKKTKLKSARSLFAAAIFRELQNSSLLSLFFWGGFSIVLMLILLVLYFLAV